MSPLLKNLFIALSITLVLSVAYIVFNRSDTGASVTGPSMNPELWARSQKILNDTNKIDNYRMDTAILSDRRFTSLVNTRVDLSGIPIETGRSNPFAPVQ